MLISLGQAIRTKRKELDLSQKELARQLQIDYQWLSKLENDRLAPDSVEVKNILPQLADIFEIEVDALEWLRSRTQQQKLDLSQAIFPIYVR